MSIIEKKHIINYMPSEDRKFLTQGKAKILACSVIENQFF